MRGHRTAGDVGGRAGRMGRVAGSGRVRASSGSGWRREAYVKACGDGLARPLAAITAGWRRVRAGRRVRDEAHPGDARTFRTPVRVEEGFSGPWRSKGSRGRGARERRRLAGGRPRLRFLASRRRGCASMVPGLPDDAARRPWTTSRESCREMYGRYPYPSREAGIRKLTGCTTCFSFSRTAAFDFRGNGCSTPARAPGTASSKAARRIWRRPPFVAVDMWASLAVARGLRGGRRAASRVQPRNLLGTFPGSGASTPSRASGVLHHLLESPPRANLVARLGDHPVPHLTALPAAANRMRRKRIVTTLMERRDDFEGGCA